MKKHLKTVGWVFVLMILIALIGAAIRINFDENSVYGDVVISLLIIQVQVFAFIFALYVLPVYFIRKRWKKNKLKSAGKKWWDSQTSKSVAKFILNGSAMFGALTIFYAFLVAIFAHFISPDNSPNANDQINEIAYQPPGFEITLIKQPLTLQSPDKGFFSTLLYGKKSAYKLIPVNNYAFSGDSLVIERFIGTGMKGETAAFELSSITGENISADENRKLVRDKFISHRKFIFGTDDLGRDYLSRIILGIRISLSVGFVAVLIALFIGIPVGAISGFYKAAPPQIKIPKRSRGYLRLPVDDFIMWLMNVIWAIPTLLLVFPIVFAFGQHYYTIFIAVGLTMWVDISRIVRGQVMQIRELEFVQAAKTFAYSDMRTIFRHILPNIAGPVIVITAANFAYAILTEAGLSFLGIGVQPPAPSWGFMISKYKDNLITNPYLPLIPGFAITLLVLAFFMIGNGLRDALDVKTKIEH